MSPIRGAGWDLIYLLVRQYVMDLNTIITSAVTLVVGLFAFIVYRIEKTDKDKSAANIILEEIRAIEKNVDKLKEAEDLINIVPSAPAFSTSGWYKHRHLLIKYFDFDEISQLSLFFERVEELKDMLNQWRLVYFGGLQVKSTHTLEKLVDLADDVKNKEEYESRKKKMTDIIHVDSYWFEASIFKNSIGSKLKLLTLISATTIGEKIKKIGKKSWVTDKI